MLAIDQRQSLRKMISKKTRQSPNTVPLDSLIQIKRAVMTGLSHKASAVLTDPLAGYAYSWDGIPGTTGVLLSLEQTGYATVNSGERLTRLLLGWNVEKALLAGADGIKLLIWFDKDTSDAVKEHQSEVVQSVGDSCSRYALPFVLEVVCYSSDSKVATRPQFAHEKALHVIDAASMYSDPRYQVDLLKLEFPGNLQYVKEFADRSFHGGTIIHDLSEIEDFCRLVNEASRVPWVILSAGVDPDEFIEGIKLCNNAGASGFLCGRAVWKDVVHHFPDTNAMENYIRTTAAQSFDSILQANSDAVPWHHHKHFK